MNTSQGDIRVSKVWFDENKLWVLLHDGRQMANPLAYFPRLLNATVEQRQRFELSGEGMAFIGISWMRTLVFQGSCWEWETSRC